ncbi:MAG: transglutaminase family protein [Bacteroidales bacterium]|nr:transglutaminase family protein [Bacteroidales bacterium]
MVEEAHNKELEALLRLMDDPDSEVYDQVKQRVLEYGTEAIPYLESAWMKLTDEQELERIEVVIDEIHQNDTSEKLKAWKNQEKPDLLEAYLLLSAFQEPDFSFEDHRKSVEKIQRDVWLEMNEDLTALEKVKVLNHIFYAVYGFKESKEKKVSPLSYLISNVLRVQKGNPLSLALLYLIIAQRSGLPVFGVNLPYHFILAYMDDTIPPKKATEYYQSDVLFYLNPFNKGVIFKQSEIDLFLKQLKIEASEDFYLPVDNLFTIKRLIIEMSLAQQRNGNASKSEALKELLKALD